MKSPLSGWPPCGSESGGDRVANAWKTQNRFLRLSSLESTFHRETLFLTCPCPRLAQRNRTTSTKYGRCLKLCVAALNVNSIENLLKSSSVVHSPLAKVLFCAVCPPFSFQPLLSFARACQSRCSYGALLLASHALLKFVFKTKTKKFA